MLYVALYRVFKGITVVYCAVMLLYFITMLYAFVVYILFYVAECGTSAIY